MNQKIMELYSKNGYNPLSGCWPLLLQMPVLLSLYSIITKPLTYLCGLDVERVASIGARLGELTLPAGGMTQNVDGPTKTMQYLMPLMSVRISFSVPAIIGDYWVFQRLLDAMLQTLLCKVYPPPASEPNVPIKEQII